MSKLSRFSSWVGVLMSLMLLFGSAVRADDPVATPAPEAAAEWQAVISGQIQAFRDHDAPGALMYAGEEFHKSYPNPTDFFIAIIQSGYAPIMESRSESFGPYQLVAPDVVMQVVKLTGNDQSTYQAIYQLTKETDGWRVHGVQLMKTPGIGV